MSRVIYRWRLIGKVHTKTIGSGDARNWLGRILFSRELVPDPPCACERAAGGPVLNHSRCAKGSSTIKVMQGPIPPMRGSTWCDDCGTAAGCMKHNSPPSGPKAGGDD